ncbi:hypothetical protein TrRE_jg12812 [Triparma retinervis]|uniref:Lipoyl-binding domain-containing protein n=1 Tax=Triparma retinervis TaxID=2557542 RepID=A0A9W7DZK5_9STRA|nr:hypothetical protein TrRE_jg12812 [Triparma retinervis]
MPFIDTDLDGASNKARVLRWYKRPGDIIEEGDTICDVEIDFDPKEVFEDHELMPVRDAVRDDNIHFQTKHDDQDYEDSGEGDGSAEGDGAEGDSEDNNKNNNETNEDKTNEDKTNEGELKGYGGSTVGSSESIIFGMDCEDEGIMGDQFLKAFESGCTQEDYEKWEKGNNVICEILCYEEEGWREKYGNGGDKQE